MTALSRHHRIAWPRSATSPTATLRRRSGMMDFLQRPLLLEGEAGVGKTEVAKALAAVHERELIRLQCYEASTRTPRSTSGTISASCSPSRRKRAAGGCRRDRGHIFSEGYLLERPLLAAIRPTETAGAAGRRDRPRRRGVRGVPARASLGLPDVASPSSALSKAVSIPRVVLTSNGTRELSDALRRRCLYHYVDFPEVDREARIILARIPASTLRSRCRSPAWWSGPQGGSAQGAGRRRDARLGGDAGRPQGHDLHEAPEAVHETMMCLLKTHEDRVRITREVTGRFSERSRESRWRQS